MALTRITKGVIKPNENYDTHNINSTGIVTAIGLDVNGNGDISGSLNFVCLMTYEDVTSIDSVGIITARGGIDCNADLDVDGHTNLDNVSVVGVTTFTDDVYFDGATAGRDIVFDRSANTLQVKPNAILKIGQGSYSTNIYTNGVNTIFDHNQNSGIFFKTNIFQIYGTGTTGGNTYDGTTFRMMTGKVELGYEVPNGGATTLDNLVTSEKGITVGTGVTIERNGQANFAGITTISGTDLVVKPSAFPGVTSQIKLGYAEQLKLRVSSANQVVMQSTGAYLQIASNTINFARADLNLNMASFRAGREIVLTHNYVDRLVTSGVGVTVYNQLDTTNLSIAGVSTFTGNIDANGDLDVDGHTNLDNVSVVGVTTFTENINLSDKIIINCKGFNSGNEQARIIVKAGDNSAGGGLRIAEYYNDDTTLFSSEIANFYTTGIELKEATTVSGDLTIAENIVHAGDTDTKIRFTNDVIQLQGGGTNRIQTNNIGARIDTTLLLYGDAGNPGRLRLQEGGALSEIMVARNSDTNSFLYFRTEISGTTATRVVIDESGHFRPFVDSTYDLGITGTRWRNLYADTLYGDGSNLTGIDTDLVSDTSPQLGGTLDGNGHTANFTANNTGLGIPIGTDANEPSAGSYKGYMRFNDDDDIIYYSDGTSWKKISAEIAVLSSISGNIFLGTTTNLTLTGTGFLSANLVVNFVQSSDGINANVTVTPSNDTSATVAVPAAVYNNVSNGNAVTIKVTNSDGSTSGTVNVTALALPSGGSIYTSGGYRYHKFTSSGTFTQTLSRTVEYLIVAGGGAGGGSNVSGNRLGGGGGAGGLRGGSVSTTPQGYTITIGAGGSGVGAQVSKRGNSGSNSSAFGVTSSGGGGGGSGDASGASGRNGGSGGSGGGGGRTGSGGSGTSGQGNNGGSGASTTNPRVQGGGGGAGAAGTAGSNNGAGGNNGYGGAGSNAYSTWASATSSGHSGYFAGGGGAGWHGSYTPTTRALGGNGGGGNGGDSSSDNSNAYGNAGTANTGGGGGGNSTTSPHNGVSGAPSGPSGGSGIVIIRYQL